MADDDDKIQPLRVEQSDMKAQIKMNSLRLDMAIGEIQELKTDSKDAVRLIRQEMQTGFSELRTEHRNLNQASKDRADRLEKWIMTLVGLTFTSAAAMVTALLTKVI